MATHSSVLAWRIPGRGSLVAAVYGVTQSRTRLKGLSSSSSTQLLPISVKVIPYCFPYSYFCNKNGSSKFEHYWDFGPKFAEWD